MRAMSASPGMTRIRPNTISRRSTYLYIGGGGRPGPLQFLSPHRPRPHGASDLLIQPHPGDRRRPVGIGAPDGESGAIAHVRLEDEEAVVVRHPHPEHLVEL